ncbi:MAG TPA: two-component regulator propeller domain-containing protein, partial [Nitrosopumilaceae archaeon]|nr:two-component regulator propeller domain-containing protein [Nitrosopumilaceae archaeon]
TIDGLSVLKQKKIYSYTQKDGLPGNKINCLLADKTGKIYIGTTEGLAFFQEGKFSQINFFKGIDVKCLAYDQKNNLIISTQNKIYKYSGEKKDSLILDNLINVLTIDKTGKIWAGTKKGLFCFSGEFKDKVVYRVSDGLIDEDILALEVDMKNQLWIGAENGLMKFDGKKFVHYKISNDVNANNVVSLRTDYEHNIWIGTHAGLFKFRDEGFVSFGDEEGLTNNFVFPILRDDNDNLWVGTQSGGLFRYNHTSFISYGKKDGILSDTVNGLMIDEKGVLWVGTGKGICMYKNQRFEPSDILKNTAIHTFYTDRKKRIWVGLDSGLACIDRNTKDNKPLVQRFSLPSKASNYQVWGFAEDNSGNLWIASYLGGLFKYDGKAFTYMNTILKIESNEIN